MRPGVVVWLKLSIVQGITEIHLVVCIIVGWIKSEELTQSNLCLWQSVQPQWAFEGLRRPGRSLRAETQQRRTQTQTEPSSLSPCYTNKTKQQKNTARPLKPCCFVTLCIFEHHVMCWHGLLRKAWVVIRSLGHFLGAFKGRPAGWIWKMLVLTQAHCAWNSLWTIGQGTTDFGFDADLSEILKRKRKILQCFFFSATLSTVPSLYLQEQFCYWNHSVLPRNTLHWITQLIVLSLTLAVLFLASSRDCQSCNSSTNVHP